MPYKSKKQRGYMHENHPKIAERWDAEERAQKGRTRKGSGKGKKRCKKGK